MIHRIYFVLLLLFFPFIANAQIGKELILNGSLRTIQQQQSLFMTMMMRTMSQ